MAEPSPRYELQPTTRFADRATDYAQFRPSYPVAVIDAALAGLGAPSTLTAADIGAGTGISSRLFADRGVQVTAVEPNESMRAAAEPHPGVRFIEGTAEASGLPDASVDLVICAQAFHWFRPHEAWREFVRIAKPSGRIVMIVNERDAADPVMRAYNEAIRAASERELSEGMRQAVEEALVAEARGVAAASFPNAQRLNREGLVGRAQSASYVPKGGPRHEQLLRDLDALWVAHRDVDGLVTLGYRTFVWTIDRGSRE